MPQRDSENRVCGFLEVDEADKKKKFKRRYVVLNKSNGLLEWYLDKPGIDGTTAPCGMINLDFITKVDVVTRLKMEYCFVINTPYRPYYMQAADQSDLEEWVEILNDAGKITVPPDALQLQPEVETVDNIQENIETLTFETENNDNNFTYRTEIVGNVVVKKKISSDGHMMKSIDTPMSPSLASGLDSATATDNATHYSFSDVIKEEDSKNIIKTGWAVKQGHLRKNWKKRFFVLREESLSYYKSDHEKEAIRTIPIHEVLAAKEEMGEASKIRDNLLFVATTDKIYYMQVDTREEMLNWLAAFNSAIKVNRIECQKKKVNLMQLKALEYTVKPNQAVKSDVKHSVTHSQSTSNLFPIVPALHCISVQVDEDFGYNLGRYDSSSEINEGNKEATASYQLRKRASEQSISSSPDSIVHSTCSSDSLAKTENPVETRKAMKFKHQRSESVVTILPTHVTGSMYSSKKSQGPLEYNEEDVLPRPESMFVTTSKSHSPYSLKGSHSNLHRSSLSNTSSKSNSNVANNLDPTVDARSTLKPSNILKKKHLPSLFLLNIMNRKKEEKISKSKSSNT